MELKTFETLQDAIDAGLSLDKLGVTFCVQVFETKAHAAVDNIEVSKKEKRLVLMAEAEALLEETDD